MTGTNGPEIEFRFVVAIKITTNRGGPIMRIQLFARLLALLAAGSLLLAGVTARANHQVNFDEGVMLEGYDVVAYHTLGKAKRGSSEFHADWLGGKWYFISQQHSDLFAGDPEKYLPQYGGYCALSYADGREHGGVDPKAFQIVEGRLYLFYGRRAVSRWNFEQPHVQEADKKWEKAKAGLLVE